MSIELRNQKLRDLVYIESAKNFPQITWNGGTYNVNASADEFTRTLEAGGYAIDRVLKATIRKYCIDDDGNTTPIFTNGYPQPQQVVTYSRNGVSYRILTVSFDDIDAAFIINCVSTVRG